MMIFPFQTKGQILSNERIYLSRWITEDAEDKFLAKIKDEAAQKKHLTRDTFLALCAWKSPRIPGKVDCNCESCVNHYTGIALGQCGWESICTLCKLRGVAHAMASVILHVAHKDPYPILDKWTLTALDIPNSTYTKSLWTQYTNLCRDKVKEFGVSIRAIDRALWVHGYQIGNPPIDPWQCKAVSCVKG